MRLFRILFTTKAYGDNFNADLVIPVSLERQPPAPTLQTGENLLHTFLGFSESKHVLSVSLRDPIDERELPANGNKYINAVCIRGVRKVGHCVVMSWSTFNHYILR